MAIFVKVITFNCVYQFVRSTGFLKHVFTFKKLHTESSEVYTLQFLCTIESYNSHCHLSFLLKLLLPLFFSFL